MATIESTDTIYNGYNVIKEKISALQEVIYNNLENGELKSYILAELAKLYDLASDYQDEFYENFGKKNNNGLSL